jgi:hypothetical protein
MLAPNSRVHGYGFPVVQGRVTVQGNATLFGLVFTSEVVLNADAVASFGFCTFLAVVTVIAGARASFGNCRFDGDSSVQSASDAGFVIVLGGAKTSGIADSGATVVDQV